MGTVERSACERFAARYALNLSFIVFAGFGLNIVLGKVSLVMDWRRDWLLGDLAEFLLLAVAAILLMIAAIARERSNKLGAANDITNNDSKREE